MADTADKVKRREEMLRKLEDCTQNADLWQATNGEAPTAMFCIGQSQFALRCIEICNGIVT